jgi:hypothetical protein
MRDQPGTAIRYLDPNAPRAATMSTPLGEYNEVLAMGELPGDSKEEYKQRRAQVVAPHEVTIRDARQADGGLAGWDFDRNGFTTVRAPEPVDDFGDRALLASDYVPQVEELAKQTLGATRAIGVSYQVRTEATGRGTSQTSYARFAHSDYGPEYEDPFRRMLTHRFGVPEDEAGSCGLCIMGFWAPIERPAFKDPLCLLDAAPTDPARLSEQSIRLLYSGLSLGRMNRDRPIEERIPVPGGDVPALAPIYSPEDQWIFVPDMTPDEALIFKHYDWRPDVASRVCFHSSFRDRFHEDWADCPGRRSIEVRVLLTF